MSDVTQLSIDTIRTLAIDAVLPTDQVFTRGTQAYANKGGRFAA